MRNPQVVPEALRSRVYAFDRCFEGAVAAFSGPLVGIVAARCVRGRGVTICPLIAMKACAGCCRIRATLILEYLNHRLQAGGSASCMDSRGWRLTDLCAGSGTWTIGRLAGRGTLRTTCATRARLATACW